MRLNLRAERTFWMLRLIWMGGGSGADVFLATLRGKVYLVGRTGLSCEFWLFLMLRKLMVALALGSIISWGSPLALSGLRLTFLVTALASSFPKAG